MKSKNIVYASLLCGILCALSPLVIPIGPIPITLATLVIYIAGTLCDIRTSVLSVVLYVVIGCLGLPVFSGLRGGIAQIIGPTGGYIIGYIPLVICVSFLNKNKAVHLLSMTAGTLILYIIGCLWYTVVTETDIRTAIAVCILPFIPGDVIKIFASMLLTPKIRRIINKS